MVIDEIKTTAAPTDAITEDMNPCHWAQGMVYGAICAEQRELETLDVRLTYYQIDTDEIIRYTRHFSAAELDAFLNDLLRQYLPWARRQLDWVEARNRAGPCNFRFQPAVPDSAPLAGGLSRLCCGQGRAEGRYPAVLPGTHRHRQNDECPLPALKAMGEGRKDLLPDRPATTQAAAGDAGPSAGGRPGAFPARRDPDRPGRKACLCKDAEAIHLPAGKPVPCASGYYTSSWKGCAGRPCWTAPSLTPYRSGRDRPAAQGLPL